MRAARFCPTTWVSRRTVALWFSCLLFISGGLGGVLIRRVRLLGGETIRPQPRVVEFFFSPAMWCDDVYAARALFTRLCLPFAKEKDIPPVR